jgi:hypothetical protein
MLAGVLSVDDLSALAVAQDVMERASIWFDAAGRFSTRPGRANPREHGEFRTYAAGCRCDDCRRANRERCYAIFAEMREAGLPDGDHRHGTVNAYKNWGCRCEPCTVANTEACRPYVKAYYERKKAAKARGAA